MTRLLRLTACLLLAGCSANTPDHVVPDASDAGTVVADTPDDEMPQPTIMPVIELGPRELPFEPWAANDDVVVIQGPQGGVHTEHRVRVTRVADVDVLHLAIVWGEVRRDDVELARAGWEFWNDQWEAVDGGYEVELPVLIFDGRPDFGPAELHARLELTDGRAVDYSLPINLVDIP